MPRVPTYDNPTVSTGALPRVGIHTQGVSPDAFGAGQGRALSAAGDMIDVGVKIWQKQREQDGITQGMEASNQLMSESQEKQQEFEQLKGKDALGIQQEFGKWHAQRQKDILGGLDNEFAQAVFKRNAQRVSLQDSGWAGNYQNKQRTIYENATFETNVENAQRSALLNPAADNVASQIGDIRSVYTEMKNRNGFDDEWVNNKVASAELKVHGDILQNAIDQDSVSGVQSYVQQWGDKLDPGLKGKAEKWVHNKVIDETAGAYADSLIGSGVSIAEARARARDKFSGDDEDKYIAKINQRYSEANDIRNENKRALVDLFEEQAYKAGGAQNISDDDLDKLSNEDAGLAMQWKTLRDKARVVQAERENGEEYSKFSYKDAVAEVEKRLTVGDENQITKPEQIAAYKPFLSKSDYAAFEKRFDSNSKVTDKQLEDAYMMFAPSDTRSKKESEWSVDDYALKALFMNKTREAVKESGNPDVIRKAAADWWRKGKDADSGLDIGGMKLFEKPTTQGAALLHGKNFTPTEKTERNVLTEAGFKQEEKQSRFVKGMRATQNGKSYVYDGANWNEE